MSENTATLEAAEAAVEAIEVKLDDIVPEVVEAVEGFRNNPVLITGVALVAASAGAFIGYKVAERRLRTKFDLLLEEEIEKTKEFYSTLNKTGDFETPAKAVEKLIPEEEREARKALSQYQGQSVEVVEDNEGLKVSVSEESENEDGDDVEVQKEIKVFQASLAGEPQTRNIFVDGNPLDDNFDYDAEVAKRSEDHPYVITEDEFFQNEQEFTQLTLTYYEGDDVLVDENDRTIDDVEGSVGEANLKRFGHGSKDKNLVYIKNNKRGTDYEIARSRGKYAVEVLGFDDEDEHSRSPKKFRGGDDE